jgi:YesN/AraC family two-component response regulator
MTTTNKQSLKLFIVEDEFIVMENIRLDVKSFGYQIVGTAANGIDAIEGILKEKPDLILMDINLKGSLSGIDVARRMLHVVLKPKTFRWYLLQLMLMRKH